MSTKRDQVSPELFFDTINAYQKSAVLKGALDLDLFTAVGEGSSTVAEIAARCDASERGTRIICDYLTIQGFLAKTDGRYALTPDSAVFLDRRSPAYLGGTARFLLAPTLRASFDDVAALVRTGTTTLPEGGSVAPEHDVWVDFARGMAPMMMPAAEFIAALVDLGDRPARVLDIAAGHGIFGVTIARHAPNAEIVALDWPAVLEVAKENAEAAGVAGRYATKPGSAFDVEFGTGYDVVLLTNFLHHFDAPTCVALLEKVRAALAPGGRAVTLEFVPNEDRVTPPMAAAFSMTMLASTPAGDAYTFAELERMFAEAGFAGSEHHRIPPGVQSVVVSRAG
jgi:2-polyprenyl-3-methyl-5-hydroxy-6-metoxy-1,4-benzoquinol methylase